MRRSPPAPHTFDCRSGVNQDAVKIEEDCLSGKDHRSGYQHHSPQLRCRTNGALTSDQSWSPVELVEADALQASVRITVNVTFH